MKFALEHHRITNYRGAPEFNDGMDELLETLKLSNQQIYQAKTSSHLSAYYVYYVK